MSSFTLTTPVVLLVFNRPDTIARVFAVIREARPSHLLVVADGPRTDRPGEAALCDEVRRIVEQVDWQCEVFHNYSETNLGCKLRVSSGLDWVFSQVEEAIILEDDCLPDASFFPYCQELLEFYRHNQQIGMISGDNFQFGRKHNEDSYYFSKYFHIWGWATWRSRWIGSYDVNIKQWPVVRDESWLSDILDDKSELAAWKINFDKVYSGKIDTWDYQWVFANWLQDRLCILPSVNLISNIGFNSQATHTKVNINIANIACSAVSFPLQHPEKVIRNTLADKFSQHVAVDESYVMSIFKRLIGWIKIPGVR